MLLISDETHYQKAGLYMRWDHVISPSNAVTTNKERGHVVEGKKLARLPWRSIPLHPNTFQQIDPSTSRGSFQNNHFVVL